MLESGWSRKKSHNEGKSVGRDRISEQPLEDSPPWQHSPLIDYYQTHIRRPIYNKQVRTISPTSDAKLLEMKSCNVNDTLHILKELEYTLPIISHPEEYYFIYYLQTCFSIGFVPPMLNVRILIEDFECMCKVQGREFQEYLVYNIFYIYIIFNNGCGYGVLEHLISCFGAYATKTSWRWRTTSMT